MNHTDSNDEAATVPEQSTPQKSVKSKPKAARKKKASKKAAKAAAPRAQSKGAKILGLIGRAKGAPLAELMKATGWQAHSVRGFLSTAAKKHRIKIESSKNESGDRVYHAAK